MKPWVFACEQTGDPRLIQAKEKLYQWALQDAPRNAAASCITWIRNRSFGWIPSICCRPWLARAGHYDEALRQIDGYWEALFDRDKQLLSHIWDDGAKRFIRKDVWALATAGLRRE